MVPGSKKVLLLDMDGVVLHQPNIQRYIVMRVNGFVRRHLEPVIKGISYHDAERINRTLYTTYGHTLLGLNAMFNLNIGVREYNTSVYDSTTIGYVLNFQDDKEMNKRANEIRELVSMCYLASIPVYVFSNAPLSWSNTVINMMGIAIDKENVLGPDHPIFDENGQLKPARGTYSQVARLIGHRHGNNRTMVFVDDSMTNIKACMGMSRWKPVLLSPDMPNLDLGSFYVRSSVQDVAGLL
jgi:FMN phosphatase YigB (HAD superfamily)